MMPGDTQTSPPPEIIESPSPVPVKYAQAIAAMAENRVIGAGSRIPWHLPEDFRWFKRLTTGHILLMGRKTFEAIGRPLPNRTTWVLSRSTFSHPGVRVLSELGQVNPAEESSVVYVCGGAEVYRQTLPYCSDLYLTVVKRVVAGDVFFPMFEDDYELVAELQDRPEFRTLHYRNRRPLAWNSALGSLGQAP